MFRNVCLAFGQILEYLQKSSESGQKSSEKCYVLWKQVKMGKLLYFYNLVYILSY